MKPDDLHTQFVTRLDALSVDPSYMPLVRRMVTEAARSAGQSATKDATRLSRELADLDAREQQLRDAFIYKAAISREVYDQEQERLRETRRALEENATRLRTPTAVDIDRTLMLCERVLTDLGGTWNRCKSNDRRRLQRLIYPEGVPVLEGRVGTAPTADEYRVFRPVEGGAEKKVALLGPGSNLWVGDLARALAS